MSRTVGEGVSRGTVSEVPKGPHWAIIQEHSVSEYDGRDSSSTTYLRYEWYLTEEPWKEKVKDLTLQKGFYSPVFRAMRVVPAEVVIDVKVDIK